MRPATPAPSPLPGQNAPAVRCEVAGPPGRYHVRILYVSSSLDYRAEHAVSVTAPDRATVISRFAIETPRWGQRAELVVFDGVPGGGRPPREIARGPVVLDGSIAILATQPRDVPAQLQRVYSNAIRPWHLGTKQPESTDPVEDEVPLQDVWVRLELAGVRLASGPVHVHVELPGDVTHDTQVALVDRDQGDQPDAPLRLPLWIDPTLRGFRQRSSDFSDGSSSSQRLLMTVANLGDLPRDVWVEHVLPKAAHHALERAWPGKPVIAGDRVRAKLVVPAGKLERVGFTVTSRE
jgi:hypothetical protein